MSENWSTIPVRGWREWRVRDGRLTGCYHREPWRPGMNESTCRTYVPPQFGFGHPPLAHGWGREFGNCSCGFYARFVPESLGYIGEKVSGMIEGWGDVVAGPEGFRASKAEIVALVVPVRERWSLRHLLKKHDVPLYRTTEAMLQDFPIERGEFPVVAEVPEDFVLTLLVDGRMTHEAARKMFGGKPVTLDGYRTAWGWQSCGGGVTVMTCPDCVAVPGYREACGTCSMKGWIE